MDQKDRRSQEVLTKAIAMELEGKDFFERAAEKMTRKRSKDMFLSLVTQEKRHIEILTHELRRLEDGRGWAPLEDAEKQLTESSGSPVFSKDGVSGLTLRPDAGELEVIDVGIEVESRSIEYYRSAGESTEDESAKQIFSWLVDEESGHLTILRAERDSRAGTGFHYGNMEFSLETE